MSLIPVVVAIVASILIGLFARGQWRGWSLLVASLLAIFWLQPATPIRYLDFWLPTACVILAFLTWLFTRPAGIGFASQDLSTSLLIVILLLLIGFTRYFGTFCCLTPSRPPSVLQIALVLLVILLLTILVLRFFPRRQSWMVLTMLLVLGLLIILKSEVLAKMASVVLRSFNSQPLELASAYDIRWLGFSYVAFRLLHALRDRLSGKLPELALQEFIIYILFFPAFSAGPIDRVQRFTQDLRQPYRLTSHALFLGSRRLLMGIFSKFVIADSLAIFALNSSNSSQVQSTAWLWVMLYAFAFRIFFDFSGYTHIAIGMGQLLGIQLPENFDRPYLKPNLTLFWNSWHITLAQWFRAYFFNPLTRSLRSSSQNIPLPLVIFIGQFATFTLIGLWHGISWNFAIWGAWHGLGLFVHNRWTDLLRSRGLGSARQVNSLYSLGGTFLTFNYVSLGWVWFTLSSPGQSWQTFLKLFGIG